MNLESLYQELSQLSLKSLRQVMVQDYGMEMGEVVLMDRLELLDAALSVEQRNAVS